MNLRQMISEVNKDIDDQLNNADIIGWLNRGLDDLTLAARYKRKVTITLVDGQTDYTLPADFLDIVSMDGSILKLDLDDYTGIGYKIIGNTLSLQPAPVNGVLNYIYLATLPRLANDDDTPVIPQNFHDLPVLYAVSKAKYADEEESMQLNAWNEYQAKKEAFIKYVSDLENAPQKVLTVYGNY